MPKVDNPENWDVADAVKKADQKFSTDSEYLMKETPEDDTLLETLVSLEKEQHEQIPQEMQQ